MEVTGSKVKLHRSIFDESYDSSFRHYKLYFQIGLNSLAACIIKPGEKKFIALEDFRFSNDKDFSKNFTEALNESRLLSMESHHLTNACSLFNSSTLVPDPLYSKEHEQLYLKFNLFPEKDFVIVSDDLRLIRVKNIYSFPTLLFELLKKRFNNLTLYHHSSVLIHSWLISAKNNSGKASFINMRENSFDLLISENKNLIFYNSFSFEICEDFLYYILFTFEQIGLNNETVQVTMVGEINPSFYSALNKYIPKLMKAKKQSEFIFPFPFHNIPESNYFSLFNQPLCEL